MENSASSQDLQSKDGNAMSSLIVYDGDCVFCKNYVQFVRLRRSIGSVELLDARSDDERVRRLWADGIDLNAGMVFIYQGRVHHGDRAVWMLSQLSSSSGIRNSLCRAMFRSPTITKAFYPLMKWGRRITLLARGKSLLNDPWA